MRKLDKYVSINCGVEMVTAHSGPITGILDSAVIKYTNIGNLRFVPRVIVNKIRNGKNSRYMFLLFRSLDIR